jgi:MFS family permease
LSLLSSLALVLFFIVRLATHEPSILKKDELMDSTLPGDDTESETSINEEQGVWTPTRTSGPFFLLLYGLANAVIGIGNITFYTLLLPERLTVIAPQAQNSAFIVISAIGALASILTNPLVGALSDRTTSTLGCRLPWLLVGGVLLLVALLSLALASSLPVLVVGSVLLQIAINVLLAALSAIIPDQVPLGQRATVSAIGGMAPLVGGLIGQVIVEQVVTDVHLAFLVLGQVSLVIVLLFCLRLHEQRLPQEILPPLRLRAIPRAYWLNPRRYPDFARTWLARCLIFLASTTLVNYLFYFLRDAVHVTQTTHMPVAQAVQLCYTLYVLALLLSSLLSGFLSDRLQRCKPFVIGASITTAIGMLLLACFPIWQVVLLSIAVLGVGFGMYLSSDLALASQLLPEAGQYGKDIGLINTAIFLPMLLAPLLAALTLGSGQHYTLLFGLIALGAVLAAIVILPIRQVR